MRDDRADALRRAADRVASRIVTSSVSDLDCATAEREAGMLFRTLLPDPLDAFDRIYGARFRRLREQFR